MKVSSARRDGVLVLSLEGRLDSIGAIDLGEFLKQHLVESDRVAVLDMNGVPYLSSAGIRTIIATEKTLKARGGALHLACVQPYPLSVLEMTGFLALLPVHASCDDAVMAARAVARQQGGDDNAGPAAWHIGGAEYLVSRTGSDQNTLDITGCPPVEWGEGCQCGAAIPVILSPGTCSMGWGAPGRQSGQSPTPMGDFLSLGPAAVWLLPESSDTLDYLIVDKKNATIPITATFLIASHGSPRYTVEVRAGKDGVGLADLIEALQEIARSSCTGYSGVLFLSFRAEVAVFISSSPGGRSAMSECSGDGPRASAGPAGTTLAGCAVAIDPLMEPFPWVDAITDSLAARLPGHPGACPRAMALAFPTPPGGPGRSPSGTVMDALSSGTPALLRHIGAGTKVLAATVEVSVISGIRHNAGTEIVIDGEAGGWNRDYERIVQQVHRECSEVRLHPISGGYSGSLVFRDDAYDRGGRREMPFVLKLDRWENIRAEIDGYEGHVKRYIQNNATQIIETARSGDYGGILYTFVGIQGQPGRIFSLEEYYLSHTTEEVLSVFDVLFRKVLRAWYGQPKIKDLPLYRIYSVIFNYGAVKEWAAARYGITPGDEYIDLPYGMGRSINPLYFMDRVIPERLSTDWNVYEGSVHGDLNMKNVLMDDNRNIWLIDFAMTGHSHILKDIAKLECVMKFEMVPVTSEGSLRTLLSLEQAFLKPSRFWDIPDIPGDIRDPGIVKAFSVVRQLRRYADTLTVLDDDIRQYYLALLSYTLCVPAFVSVTDPMKEYAWVSSSILCNALK